MGTFESQKNIAFQFVACRMCVHLGLKLFETMGFVLHGGANHKPTDLILDGCSLAIQWVGDCVGMIA